MPFRHEVIRNYSCTVCCSASRDFAVFIIIEFVQQRRDYTCLYISVHTSSKLRTHKYFMNTLTFFHELSCPSSHFHSANVDVVPCAVQLGQRIDFLGNVPISNTVMLFCKSQKCEIIPHHTNNATLFYTLIICVCVTDYLGYYTIVCMMRTYTAAVILLQSLQLYMCTHWTRGLLYNLCTHCTRGLLYNLCISSQLLSERSCC